ncbi:MAG: OmpA family protein [Pseudomonadota bacterium]
MNTKEKGDLGAAGPVSRTSTTVASPGMGPPRRVFMGAALAGAAVAGLAAIGLLGAQAAPQTDVFRFTRGVEFAPGEEARLRGHLANLAAQPDRLVRIVGHTGQQGDPSANAELSEARAAAALAIARDVGLPETRLLSVAGVGGGAPLSRSQDMTEREWERSLSRVSITDQARP